MLQPHSRPDALVGEWREPALRLFLQTITKATVVTQRQAVSPITAVFTNRRINSSTAIVPMQMVIASNRRFWCFCRVFLFSVTATPAWAEPKLFESRQVTPAGEYTFGIEGPAADLDGNLFVVNIGKPGTIGNCLLEVRIRRSS